MEVAWYRYFEKLSDSSRMIEEVMYREILSHVTNMRMMAKI